MNAKKLTISVDFDGTIFTNKYPKKGVLIPKAKLMINKWFNQGHTILINTCRSGDAEREAESLLLSNDVKFHYLNRNNPYLIEKYGNDSRKLGADLYIDDKDSRMFVDWEYEDEAVKKLSEDKKTIIAIVGKSGTGKTTCAEYIEREFGITMVESHTDRDKRNPNELGHTFHTKEEFDKLKREDMIAYTNFGQHRYCCLKSDLQRINTYVIDEYGLSLLDKEVYNVIPIRLYCSKKELRKRIDSERALRDKGRFSFFHPWLVFLSKYDYCINTSHNNLHTQHKINSVIKRIMSNL